MMVCKRCGEPTASILCWVDPNDRSVVDDTPQKPPYCWECDRDTELVDYSDYLRDLLDGAADDAEDKAERGRP